MIRSILNRITGHIVKLMLLIAVFASLSSLPAHAEDIEVDEVRVEGLYSIGQSELLYLLGIEKGATLDTMSLRRGVKRAFKKGIFNGISVESVDGEAGVLLVRVEEKDFIKSIKVQSTGSVNPRFIKKQLGLAAGDQVRYDRMDSYISEVRDLLRQKGYPDSAVSVDLKESSPHRINMVIHINEGMPLRLRKINVIGRPASEVVGHMKVSENSVYDQFQLKKDIEKLTKYYSKENYLNPVVGPYTYSDHVLHIHVDPGKRLNLRFKGNDHLSRKKLLRELPFFDAGDVRDDLIDEGVTRMLNAYHARGYPDAQIASVLSSEQDEITLTFFIYEGPRVKVKDIQLEGVTLPEESLKRIMPLRENDRYNPDVMDNVVQAIIDFYGSLGYINAHVSTPKVAIDEDGAVLTIHIDEGLQIILKEIGIEGVYSIPSEDIADRISLGVGQPYNEVDISDSRRAIVSLYREHGFLDAEVRVKTDFDVIGGVLVTFIVEEGEKYHFGKTLIKGNKKTRLRVIRRELQFEEGEPLNKADMLSARQRIYKTGLFSDVNMDILERYDNKGDVVVDVEEGHAGAFEFGLGYGEYDRFRGFFDVSYKNLFGMNRSGAFRTELSSLMRRHIFRYNEPWFLETKTPLRAYFINEDRKEINIDTGEVKYRVERYTGGVGIERKLSDQVTFDLLYEYSFTDTRDVIPDIILSREDTGTLGISSITPSISYDSRDNPFDPKRGLYAGVSIKTASIVLLSETDFFKLVAFGSTFKELSKRVVLAASARGGLAQGMRDTRDLPLIERFFLGGRSTVRGFRQDDLGPKGAQGTPLGGNLFLLGNLEFRIGIAKGWRFVTFFDTGAVWLDDTELDLTELRFTAGVGLQYNTPVGPIRIDYGRKLDRRADESGGEVHFSIGHAF